MFVADLENLVRVDLMMNDGQCQNKRRWAQLLCREVQSTFQYMTQGLFVCNVDTSRKVSLCENKK